MGILRGIVVVGLMGHGLFATEVDCGQESRKISLKPQKSESQIEKERNFRARLNASSKPVRKDQPIIDPVVISVLKGDSFYFESGISEKKQKSDRQKVKEREIKQRIWRSGKPIQEIEPRLGTPVMAVIPRIPD